MRKFKSKLASASFAIFYSLNFSQCQFVNISFIKISPYLCYVTLTFHGESITDNYDSTINRSWVFLTYWPNTGSTVVQLTLLTSTK